MARFATSRVVSHDHEHDEDDASHNSGWFSRGEEAAAAARKQAGSMYKPEFWLKDGETAEVIFLDKESINIWAHTVYRNGRQRKYTCRRRGCPLCRVDEARVISVYRVLDLRIFAPKDGKKARDQFDFRQKYWEVGSRLQPTIAKLLDKGLLYKKVAEVSRDGEGTKTTYQVIPIGPIDPEFKEQLRERELLTPALEFEEDYAPKSLEDLEILAESLSGGKQYHDGDDAPRAARRSGAAGGGRRSAAAAGGRSAPRAPARRSYLDDADEGDEGTYLNAGDEDGVPF